MCSCRDPLILHRNKNYVIIAISIAINLKNLPMKDNLRIRDKDLCTMAPLTKCIERMNRAIIICAVYKLDLLNFIVQNKYWAVCDYLHLQLHDTLIWSPGVNEVLMYSQNYIRGNTPPPPNSKPCQYWWAAKFESLAAFHWVFHHPQSYKYVTMKKG